MALRIWLPRWARAAQLSWWGILFQQQYSAHGISGYYKERMSDSGFPSPTVEYDKSKIDFKPTDVKPMVDIDLNRNPIVHFGWTVGWLVTVHFKGNGFQTNGWKTNGWYWFESESNCTLWMNGWFVGWWLFISKELDFKPTVRKPMVDIDLYRNPIVHFEWTVC